MGLSIREIGYSSASAGPSDDAFGFRRTRAGFHPWVIDGPTSLARKPRIAHSG